MWEKRLINMNSVTHVGEMCDDYDQFCTSCGTKKCMMIMNSSVTEMGNRTL